MPDTGLDIGNSEMTLSPSFLKDLTIQEEKNDR